MIALSLFRTFVRLLTFVAGSWLLFHLWLLCNGELISVVPVVIMPFVLWACVTMLGEVEEELERRSGL